ncbi:Winged helix-like DNA-binding domain superfamily, partial [Sesbania bispinosa]
MANSAPESPKKERRNGKGTLLVADGNERLYQFSDMSLLANESFQKQMNKDPEGYVPITLIASTKKIKSLISNIHLLTQALRYSSKL